MTSARKEKVAYRVKIFGAKLCILPNKNPRNCVKKNKQSELSKAETTKSTCRVTGAHKRVA